MTQSTVGAVPAAKRSEMTLVAFSLVVGSLGVALLTVNALILFHKYWRSGFKDLLILAASLSRAYLVVVSVLIVFGYTRDTTAIAVNLQLAWLGIILSEFISHFERALTKRLTKRQPRHDDPATDHPTR